MNKSPLVILASILGFCYLICQLLITLSIGLFIENPLDLFLQAEDADIIYFALILLSVVFFAIGNSQSLAPYLLIPLVMIESYYSFLFDYENLEAPINAIDLYLYPDGFPYIILLYTTATYTYANIDAFKSSNTQVPS